MHEYNSEFDDWQSAFAGWTDISVSELHGMLTGIVCVAQAPTEAEWQQLLHELSFAIPSAQALALLTQYGEDVAFAVSDSDDALEFAPLVPDDDWALDLRVLALKDWAGGFISGIGVADTYLQADERQALSDLAKVASVRLPSDVGEETALDFTDEAQMPANLDDEQETQYFELYEFARLVPAMFARRQKKPVQELAIIKGLAMGRKTASESD